MKPVKVRTAMPLVKVIRNGQITIPKELRAALGIFEKSRELSRDPDRRSGYVFEIKSGYIGNRLVIYISCGRWRPSGQWFPTWVKIRSSTSEPGRGPDRSPLTLETCNMPSSWISAMFGCADWSAGVFLNSRRLRHEIKANSPQTKTWEEGW